MEIFLALRKLASFKRYIFILDQQLLRNPLIKEDHIQLQTKGLLELSGVSELIKGPLLNADLEPPTGMYFPVPMARAFEREKSLESEIIARFHYDFIRVDDCQQWHLRDKIISGKVLEFFISNLSFESATDRHFIEYWSETRWDKCYLECSLTPMLALSLSFRRGRFSMLLNNGVIDEATAGELRIDEKERCFLRSRQHGEVLLADTPRFWLLSHLDSTGTRVILENKSFLVITET